ncbi:MAG: phosphonate ABC transporter ATP-binding protein [Magnetovibrionaceae bacterium]
MRPPALLVEHLAKSFAGREVFRDVSFSLGSCDMACLIGANGAGKSTLLRSCLHLVKPDSGRVDLNGVALDGLKDHQLRQARTHVGFVFQKHNLVPRISALGNVLLGAGGRVYGPLTWWQAISPRSLREEAMDCLDRVGLAEKADTRADRLSGGQSQRVAIARALMQRPTFVFADEPVASLDPKSGRRVMDLFARLMADEKIGLFFTSHNLDHATAYAGRVIGLAHGKVAIDRPSAGLSPNDLGALYD